MQIRSIAVAALAAVALAAGCGKGVTYHVSGKATFKGEPIQNGRIYFDPDMGKKNLDARQGYAEIKGGQFDTSTPGSKGVSGGAYLVRIEAFDGAGTDPDRPAGKPLFNWFQAPVELPNEATTKDFDVPASAITAKPPGEKTAVGGQGP